MVYIIVLDEESIRITWRGPSSTRLAIASHLLRTRPPPAGHPTGTQLARAWYGPADGLHVAR